MPLEVRAGALFAEIVAQRRSVAAGPFANLAAFDALMGSGLLQQAGVAQSVHCDDCDMPHDAEVVFENDASGIYCPELGFIKKERHALALIAPNIGAFISQIADDLGCKRRKSSPIHGDTWRLGTVEMPTAEVALYFYPTLNHAADLEALERALASEMRSELGLVLTAAGRLRTLSFKTLRMAEYLGFDEGAGAFEFDGDLAAIMGLRKQRVGGRPNQHKENISKIHLERIAKGIAEAGRNAEAKEILATYKAEYPTEKAPSLSTVRRYLTDFQTGS